MMLLCDRFLSFFLNPGFHSIGACIIKHLSTKDIIAFMQVKNDFKSFVLQNRDIRRILVMKFENLSAKDVIDLMQENDDSENFVLENEEFRRIFIKKAQVECAEKIIKAQDFNVHQIEEPLDPLDYIMDDPMNVSDERKQKVSVLRLKLQIQFADKVWNYDYDWKPHLHPSCLEFALHLDPKAEDGFTKEFKKLLNYMIDSELATVFRFLTGKWYENQFASDLALLTLKQFQDKTLILDDTGKTVLHHLGAPWGSIRPIFEAHLHMLKLWIQALPEAHRCPMDFAGSTPLHCFCSESNFRYNSIEFLHILCQNMTKEQMNLQDQYGKTALHYACATSSADRLALANRGLNTEIIEALIKYLPKESFGLQDVRGETALHHACINDSVNIEVIQLLCQYMTKEEIGLKNEDGMTPLHAACANYAAHVDVVQCLWQNIEDQFDLQDKNGYTPLHHASSNFHTNVKVVQFLSQNMTKDQIGLQNNNGATALHHASGKVYAKANLEVVQILCQSMDKDHVGFQDNVGNTPLHNACINIISSNAEVVEILCQNALGNVLGLQNKDGKTALHLASCKAFNNVVQNLCQKMTKDQLELQDKDGKTALHHACANYDFGLGIVQVLCQYLSKEQVELQDNQGKKAFHYARNLKIKEYLAPQFFVHSRD